MADDPQALAGAQTEGDAVQALAGAAPGEGGGAPGGAGPGVGEGDAVKFDQRAVLPALPLGEDGLVLGGAEDLGDPVRGGGGLGEEQEDAVEGHGAVEDQVEVDQEGQDDPRFRRAAVHPAGSHQHHQDQAQVHEQLHRRGGDGHDGAGGKVAAGQAAVDLPEAALLVFLLMEGLDHADAGDVLPHDPGHAVHLLLDPVVEGDALPGDQDHDGRHHRGQDAQDGGQGRVHGQGYAHAAHQHDGGPDAHGLDGGDEILNVVGVGGHPGDQGGQAEAV